MLTVRKNLIVIVVGMFVLALGAPSWAGVIQPLGNTGWSYEVSDQVANNVSIAVDPSSTTSLVVLEITKTYASSSFQLNQGDSIWIDLILDDPGAAQNIAIVDEKVKNQTGRTWYDFHIGLVQNSKPLNRSGPYVGFDESVGFEKVAGKNPFTAQYESYNGINNMPLWIELADGEVPDGTDLLLGEGGSANNYVQIYVDTSKMLVGEIFSIKEYPTIPEPMTISLLAIGVLVFARRRKKA